MPRDKVLFVSPGGEVFGSFLPAQKGTLPFFDPLAAKHAAPVGQCQTAGDQLKPAGHGLHRATDGGVR